MAAPGYLDTDRGAYPADVTRRTRRRGKTMLPEEDVRMPSTRFGLRRWLEREVTTPLTAMYAHIDEHLLEGSADQGSPPTAPKTVRPSTSE